MKYQDIKELNHDYRILTYLKNSGSRTLSDGVKSLKIETTTAAGPKPTRSASTFSSPPAANGCRTRHVLAGDSFGKHVWFVLALQSRTRGIFFLRVVSHGQGHLHANSHRVGLPPSYWAVSCSKQAEPAIGGHSSSESTLDLKR